MPTPVRVTPKKKRAKKKPVGLSSNLRARAINIGEEEGGIKFSVYGRGKTGKTRFACSFPGPLMLLGCAGYGTERGTRSLGRIKGGKFFEVAHSEEVLGFAQIAVEDGYKSVVLDTAGGLQQRVVNEFIGREASVRKDWSVVDRGDWGPINSRTMERLRTLLDLADNYNVNVVIIAHERNFNEESVEHIAPSVGSALTPGVANWLNGACDYIAQCFIREATEKKEVRIAGKKKTMQTKTGKVEFCLRVGPHPVYMTGFRVPPGVDLPDVVVNPTYDKVCKLITGE